MVNQIIKLVCIFALLGACTTPEKQEDNQEEDSQEDSSEEEEDYGGSVSEFFLSLSNENMNPAHIDGKELSKIRSMLGQFRGRKNHYNLQIYKQIINGQRNSYKLYQAALVDSNFSKGIPKLVLAKIALLGIYDGNFGLSLSIIDRLKKSSRPKGKSDAFNLQGLLEYRKGEVTEAIYSWEQALKVDAKHLAARLNLATAYMAFGYYDKADSMLENAEGSKIVDILRITSKRLSGDNKGVESLCNKLYNSNIAQVHINCGIYWSEVAKDKKMAARFASRAEVLNKNSAWQEKIDKL